MSELLRRGSIDLVQYETIAMAPYGRLAPELPQVLVHQNVESSLMRRRADAHANPLERWYVRAQAAKLQAAEANYLETIDAHVAVSDEDRDSFLRARPGARVRTVVNGVDEEFFRPGPKPEGAGASFIFVGGMSWYPNEDAMRWFFKEIWSSIRQRRSDASVTIIGSHPSAEVRREAAADPKHVRVTGLVPDIRPYVDDAAVFVCPFQVGGGTRLKILDAWSMQKAILSTSLGLRRARGSRWARSLDCG